MIIKGKLKLSSVISVMVSVMLFFSGIPTVYADENLENANISAETRMSVAASPLTQAAISSVFGQNSFYQSISTKYTEAFYNEYSNSEAEIKLFALDNDSWLPLSVAVARNENVDGGITFEFSRSSEETVYNRYRIELGIKDIGDSESLTFVPVQYFEFNNNTEGSAGGDGIMSFVNDFSDTCADNTLTTSLDASVSTKHYIIDPVLVLNYDSDGIYYNVTVRFSNDCPNYAYAKLMEWEKTDSGYKDKGGSSSWGNRNGTFPTDVSSGLSVSNQPTSYLFKLGVVFPEDESDDLFTHYSSCGYYTSWEWYAIVDIDPAAISSNIGNAITIPFVENSYYSDSMGRFDKLSVGKPMISYDEDSGKVTYTSTVDYSVGSCDKVNLCFGVGNESGESWIVDEIVSNGIGSITLSTMENITDDYDYVWAGIYEYPNGDSGNFLAYSKSYLSEQNTNTPSTDNDVADTPNDEWVKEESRNEIEDARFTIKYYDDHTDVFVTAKFSESYNRSGIPIMWLYKWDGSEYKCFDRVADSLRDDKIIELRASISRPETLSYYSIRLGTVYYYLGDDGLGHFFGTAEEVAQFTLNPADFGTSTPDNRGEFNEYPESCTATYEIDTEDNVEKYSDSVRIMGYPSINYNESTGEITYTASVAYQLASCDRGIIYLGFGDETGYNLYGEQIVGKTYNGNEGTTIITATVKSTAKRDRMYVNLSEYPHESTWTPLAYNYIVLSDNIRPSESETVTPTTPPQTGPSSYNTPTSFIDPVVTVVTKEDKEKEEVKEDKKDTEKSYTISNSTDIDVMKIEVNMEKYENSIDIRIEKNDSPSVNMENLIYHYAKETKTSRYAYLPMEISVYDIETNKELKKLDEGAEITFFIAIPERLYKYRDKMKVLHLDGEELEVIECTPIVNKTTGQKGIKFTMTHFSPTNLYVDADDMSDYDYEDIQSYAWLTDKGDEVYDVSSGYGIYDFGQIAVIIDEIDPCKRRIFMVIDFLMIAAFVARCSVKKKHKYSKVD